MLKREPQKYKEKKKRKEKKEKRMPHRLKEQS